MGDDDHISMALQQIDSESWLLGNVVLRRLLYASESSSWNDGHDQSSYIFEEAHIPHPQTTPLSDNQYVRVVHQIGNASAVWAIGANALCKVKRVEEDVTSEATTLQFVQGQRPSFSTPAVLFNMVYCGRSYLFL